MGSPQSKEWVWVVVRSVMDSCGGIVASSPESAHTTPDVARGFAARSAAEFLAAHPDYTLREETRGWVCESDRGTAWFSVQRIPFWR